MNITLTLNNLEIEEISRQPNWNYRFTVWFKRPLYEIELGDYIETRVIGDSELFLQETNIKGVYRYGLKQLKDTADHKAGYIWTSRTGVINHVFSKRMTEIVIDSWGGFCVDANELSEFVNNKQKDITYTSVYEYNAGDEIFELQDIKHRYTELNVKFYGKDDKLIPGAETRMTVKLGDYQEFGGEYIEEPDAPNYDDVARQARDYIKEHNLPEGTWWSY